MAIPKPQANRPLKYGESDRRQFIVEDSEVELRCENDANGNPIYVGRAKVGVLTSESKWQIKFISYDANNSVTSVKWPQDGSGVGSADYEFEWDDRATYTYV